MCAYTKLPRPMPRDMDNGDDYLKYYRIVRYYYMRKNELTLDQFELLMFIYSEEKFTMEEIFLYCRTFQFSKTMFSGLMEKGFVEVHSLGKRNYAAIRYRISAKGTGLVKRVYNILNGEDIPYLSGANQPMFQRKARFTDKVYRNMIIHMQKMYAKKSRSKAVEQSEQIEDWIPDYQ